MRMKDSPGRDAPGMGVTDETFVHRNEITRLHEIIERQKAGNSDLRDENISLLHLLALIREACGDNGRHMQDELVTFIRDQRQGHINHIALLQAALKKERVEAVELRDALLTAHDHINMHALRISHCRTRTRSRLRYWRNHEHHARPTAAARAG